MTDLSGKIALVTGGGSGIGRAGVEAFARAGATVVIAEIDEATGREAESALRAQQFEARFVRTDVSDQASAEAAIHFTVSQFGKLDILYNNAGASLPGDGPATTSEIDTFWNTIRLNLFGTWLMCRYAIPAIVKAGGGAVVNTTSIAGLVGLHRLDSYTCAKGGIVALTRSLAAQFAADRVRVNAVAPTATLTPRAVALEAKRNSGGTLRNLLGPARPEDIASAALFLASADADRITGHTLPVDSGYTMC